jgi:hypothetical protein
MFGTGQWVEEVTQLRRRKNHPPRYYIVRTALWVSGFWLALIGCSLLMALTGH